jgi:hypothetical protein
MGAIELESFGLGVSRLEIELAIAKLTGALFHALHELKADAEAT